MSVSPDRRPWKDVLENVASLVPEFLLPKVDDLLWRRMLGRVLTGECEDEAPEGDRAIARLTAESALGNEDNGAGGDMASDA